MNQISWIVRGPTEDAELGDDAAGNGPSLSSEVRGDRLTSAADALAFVVDDQARLDSTDDPFVGFHVIPPVDRTDRNAVGRQYMLVDGDILARSVRAEVFDLRPVTIRLAGQGMLLATSCWVPVRVFGGLLPDHRRRVRCGPLNGPGTETGGPDIVAWGGAANKSRFAVFPASDGSDSAFGTSKTDLRVAIAPIAP